MVFVRWYLMALPLHTIPPAVLNFFVGASLGGLYTWGSEHGYYHTVALPLMALAMEGGGFSIWGSLDLGNHPFLIVILALDNYPPLMIFAFP